MPLLTLLLLGIIGAVVLYLLRANRHRWAENESTREPMRDGDSER